MRSLRELLTSAEQNIGRYLKQDARWGVFLIHRVGHHEWVPERMESSTHSLDAAWEGTWLLEKGFRDWRPLAPPVSGRAIIRRNGEFTQISVHAQREEGPLENVADCTLRYSGGLTYLPHLAPTGQAWTDTTLGYLYGAGSNRSGSSYDNQGNGEAFAPFDPNKQYKQVLIQCPKAESDDSDRVRFLLLAGDTLVEVATLAPYGEALYLRHYKRAR